jgi:hypothetical protein
MKTVRYQPDPMVKQEALEFVRAYHKIEDPDVRQMVYEMIKTLGESAAKDS